MKLAFLFGETNKHDIFYAGGKMANCGGVCVSQFEMQQNASKSQWEPSVVDKKES